MLRAGKVVGGHVVAGEGVHRGPQPGEFPGDVPAVRHIEELVLQIVGSAGGGAVFPALQFEMVMDGAVVHRQVAQLLGKALLGHHADGKPAFKGFPV